MLFGVISASCTDSSAPSVIGDRMQHHVHLLEQRARLGIVHQLLAELQNVAGAGNFVGVLAAGINDGRLERGFLGPRAQHRGRRQHHVGGPQIFAQITAAHPIHVDARMSAPSCASIDGIFVGTDRLIPLHRCDRLRSRVIRDHRTRTRGRRDVQARVFARRGRFDFRRQAASGSSNSNAICFRCGYASSSL